MFSPPSHCNSFFLAPVVVLVVVIVVVLVVIVVFVANFHIFIPLQDRHPKDIFSTVATHSLLNLWERLDAGTTVHIPLQQQSKTDLFSTQQSIKSS